MRRADQLRIQGFILWKGIQLLYLIFFFSFFLAALIATSTGTIHAPLTFETVLLGS